MSDDHWTDWRLIDKAWGKWGLHLSDRNSFSKISLDDDGQLRHKFVSWLER